MPVNFNVRTKIKINGREYNTPDEMPPEVRSLYDKAMAGRTSTPPNIQINTSSKITFNGQTYNSTDEMPEDVHRIYESIMAAVDKDSDGIPDVLQTGESPAMKPSAPFLPAQNPVIAASRSNSRFMIVGVTVFFILLAIAVLLLVLPK